MEYVLEHLEHLLVLGLVFTPLELLFPERRRERYLREKWTLDMTFALLNVVFIAVGLVALLVLGNVVGGALVPGVRAWVGVQSLWLQVPAALLITDFLWYWTHRIAHTVPFLWRFHAVHHSIEMMDWMAGHRVHPVDQILTRGSGLLVLSLLGFAPAAFAITGGIFMWQGALEHSNLPIRGGVLRHVIVFPEFHHWHHADHPEAYDTNFGGHFSFFDRLFGTWFESDGPPERYGCDTKVEGGFVDLLFFPIRRPAPATAAAEPERLDEVGYGSARTRTGGAARASPP
jgi:sterol desaturase/sphingolipid hydroxylase (fatty acid hydroxylase superfamily)